MLNIYQCQYCTPINCNWLLADSYLCSEVCYSWSDLDVGCLFSESSECRRSEGLPQKEIHHQIGYPLHPMGSPQSHGSANTVKWGTRGALGDVRGCYLDKGSFFSIDWLHAICIGSLSVFDSMPNACLRMNNTRERLFMSHT